MKRTSTKTFDRLSIVVRGRGSLPEHDARDVLQQALVRMADDAGFDAPDLIQW